METPDQRLLKLFDSVGDETEASSIAKTSSQNLASNPANRVALLGPALEVDHFVFPPVCKALRDCLNTVATPLVDTVFDAAGKGMRVILLTSGARQSGRTTTALSLAATLARRPCRVCLIDADVQQATIARQLRIEPLVGWQQYSSDPQPLDEYLIESLADCFSILPCTADPQPTHWPGHWDLASILESLRDHYDLVLVDAMPLEQTGLGWGMLQDCGPFIDAALWIETHPTDTIWAHRQLQAAGIQLLGLVQRAQAMAQVA